MGPFTVNLWERANSTDQDGELFEYLYSHSAYAGRQNFAPVDAFHPNQVQQPQSSGCDICLIVTCLRSHTGRMCVFTHVHYPITARS